MCSVEGCKTNAGLRRGLCVMHYTRMRRTGTTNFERPSLMDRFNAGVDKNAAGGCWVWTRALCSKGYGAIQLGVGVTGKAHRVSWELHRAKIPEGMFVLHSCDAPACCNPDHLFIGTHDDNMRDMKMKRRSAHGERNGKAKLNEDQIAKIMSDKRPATALGPEFGVHPETIRRVRKMESWVDAVRPQASEGATA